MREYLQWGENTAWVLIFYLATGDLCVHIYKHKKTREDDIYKPAFGEKMQVHMIGNDFQYIGKEKILICQKGT